MTSSRLLLVLAIAATLSSGACGRTPGIPAEATLARAADFAVATREDGEIVMTLPADFPADVFIPQPRTLGSVVEVAGMQMVNLTVPVGMRPLSGEIEETMRAGGWKREMALQADGGATLMYRKDQRQTVYLLAPGDAGGTQLAVRTGLGG